MNTVYDRSESIRESVDDVKFSLEIRYRPDHLVIFVFLRNVSATIIPSLALPLSVVGTFAAMSLLGYTLDNLSLMALTLAGREPVVDDAIVVPRKSSCGTWKWAKPGWKRRWRVGKRSRSPFSP